MMKDWEGPAAVILVQRSKLTQSWFCEGWGQMPTLYPSLTQKSACGDLFRLGNPISSLSYHSSYS
eukprot:scaffold169246_cov40-Cyclotella_meneghiniana.AAC.1